MTRRWTAVSVTVRRDGAEGVEAFLLDHGAPGLVTDESGDTVRVTGHFSGPPPLTELERYCASLGKLFTGLPRPVIAIETLQEEAWAENWKAHFPAQSVGDRLFVHPPWATGIPGGRIGVCLNPGMAFGTGHHATTRGCLLLLERALAARSGASVLDIGTGSGILAIAAAKLDAGDVFAVDTDPAACQIARHNAAANDVAKRVRFGASVEDAAGKYDIVLANLLTTTLVELTPAIVPRLHRSGTVIGSGILSEEEGIVASAWRARGLVCGDRYTEAGWVSVAWRRRERKTGP